MAENEPRGSVRSDELDNGRPVAPQGFEHCRFCIRMVGDHCRKRGCLEAAYRAGALFVPSPSVEEAYGVGPGDVRAVGAGQTGETLTTSGWSRDPEDKP